MLPPDERAGPQAATMTLLVDSVRQVNERLERIDHMLRGNGKVGILTDIALMESRVKNLERMHRDFQAMRRWIILSLLSFSGTLIWQVVSWALKNGATE